MAYIRFCCQMRGWSGGLNGIDVEAPNVRAALRELKVRFPRIPSAVIDESGLAGAYWQMFLNDREVKNANFDTTTLSPQDEIYPLPTPVALTPEQFRKMLRRDALHSRQ